MAELTPLSFPRLLARMLRELDRQQTIFDLPRSKFFLGDPDRDLSVPIHGQTASSPLGPAAGPHSQLAQNIVLAWLGGARIIELKTVQILDELDIGRPCIDAQTVGYNIEWSQELRLEQSLEEYVKASMLIDILVASGQIELARGFDRVVFDMSVGYDLAGIQSDRVRAFMDGMKDASAIVDRLRAQIPTSLARYRELDFRTRLSNSLTLSTFHGCPPDEIERIIDFLLRDYGLHCVVKLNPTLLGPERVRALMADCLGYTDIETPAAAFEKDAQWDQMLGFVDRLGVTADSLGLGLGVKFSNTLIVNNHRDFFPATEKEMYLSGQPLHVLAMNLVRDFRREFGSRFPVSFSAGIDRHNFTDAVALGLVPITVCTDLLRPGGYGRQAGYFQTLAKRMDDVQASSTGEFILRAFGAARAALEQAGGEWSPEFDAAAASGSPLLPLATPEMQARWLAAAAVLNTELYVEAATADQRYRKPANSKPPKKLGTKLELFNCITCDKCIPVCPNDATVTLNIPPIEVPVLKLSKADNAWTATEVDPIVLDKKHQIANYADFCNDCGNCDIFCPEDGGPYAIKPRFFGSLDAWSAAPSLDGFFLESATGSQTIHGRFHGLAFSMTVNDQGTRFVGDGFDILFDPADPLGTVRGNASREVDLTYCLIMSELCKSLLAPDAAVNFVNA